VRFSVDSRIEEILRFAKPLTQMARKNGERLESRGGYPEYLARKAGR